MKLSAQDSFRTSVVAVVLAFGGLVGYLVGKWTHDPQIGVLILAIFTPLATAVSAYGNVLAERGAKVQALAGHEANAVAITEVARDAAQQVAEVADAAGVPAPGVPGSGARLGVDNL